MTVTRLVLALVFVCGTAWAETAPATVTCKDGSMSKGGRGACRGHGGVDKTKEAGAPAPAATPSPPAAKTAPPPTAAPAPAARATTPAPTTTAKTSSSGKVATDDPTGAIAKCKDGMYWHGSKHSGSCSHHGGVGEWLDGTQKK